MLVAGLRNNPDEMEGMRRGQPWQAQPWRATPARATLPAPWQNNRVLWQGACGSFIEKDDEALQARKEDQVVLGGPSLRRCTSRRHGAGVGGGGNPEGGGGGGNPGRDNPHKGNPGGADLVGNPGGGKPVTLARATLPKAKLESWKGILGATGIGQPPWRGATLAGATLAGATLAGATLTAATLVGANLAGATLVGFRV